MFDPLHDLFRHHPAHHFGRLDRFSRDQGKFALDQFEELEQRKPIPNEFEEQWRRSYRTPERFIGDLAPTLVILLAGAVMLLHFGSPEQARQQRQPMTTATEMMNR